MVWAKAALVGGLLVVCAAFAFGTEHRVTASVMGQTQDCGASIPPSWFVTGTPNPAPEPRPGATADERRGAAACSIAINQFRVLIVSTMAIGGLLALVGWSAIRARPEAKPRQVGLVHT